MKLAVLRQVQRMTASCAQLLDETREPTDWELRSLALHLHKVSAELNLWLKRESQPEAEDAAE